jgi:hypothetical protein
MALALLAIGGGSTVFCCVLLRMARKIRFTLSSDEIRYWRAGGTLSPIFIFAPCGFLVVVWRDCFGALEMLVPFSVSPI